MAHAECNKKIMKVIELLDDRNMSFSFCLNKIETLKLCAISLMHQSLHLKQDSKLMSDIRRSVAAVVDYLRQNESHGAVELASLAKSLLVMQDEQTGLAMKKSRTGPVNIEVMTRP